MNKQVFVITLRCGHVIENARAPRMGEFMYCNECTDKHGFVKTRAKDWRQQKRWRKVVAIDPSPPYISWKPPVP